jgi:gliding motility-associated-like protein
MQNKLCSIIFISIFSFSQLIAQNISLCSNIDSNLCYSTQPFPLVNFAIEKKFESTENTAVYQSPLLADFDGDCIPEIIMAGTIGYQSNPNLSSGIVILNSSTGQNIDIIQTAFYGVHGATGFAVADINFDGIPEFIVAAANHTSNSINLRGRLICYNSDGTILWISDELFGEYATNRFAGSIGLADFNQDGIPEIYIYNEIFNGQNGFKLCDGGSNGIGTSGASAIYGNSSIVIAGQLDDNPNDLELAAGYSIYKVVINNMNGQLGNSMLPYNIQVDGAFRDGYTSMGDINLDGKIDVIVSSPGQFPNGKLYVYTISGNVVSLIAKYSPTNGNCCSLSLMGPPFIGDIDGSGEPSIGITRAELLMTYKYNGTINLTQSWVIPTNDRSGRTGMTMFDFNQDGIQEIVYRDETELRIINGSAIPPIDLAVFSCFSGTVVEYPIIGDIDNSGESKICVTCGTGNNGLDGAIGKLSVFGAPAGQQPWAPSRGLWNQYAYHVFNVNDNLTIPAQQNNNASFSNGTYNNFYVQASLLDVNGNFLQQVPELSGQINCVNFDWISQEYLVTYSVNNAINASLNAPSGISIAFFDGDPQVNGNLIGTTSTTLEIAQGDTLNNLSFSFTNSLTELFMVLNSDGSTSGQPFTVNDYNLLECDYSNNIISFQNLPLVEEINDTICANQELYYYGTSFNQSGVYYYSVQDISGCDSLMSKLNLTVNPTFVFIDSITVCDEYTWSVNGQTYIASGTFIEILQNQFGCDSTLILELIINESTVYSENISSCDEFTWGVNGQTYSNSGTYYEILQNQFSCDSIRILELIINESEIFLETIISCEEYTWPLNGQTYNSSGLYSALLQTSGGCDSIVVLDLMILYNTSSQTTIETCDSYFWNGQTYTQSGIIQYQTLNSSGCDSITTLNLTILNSVQTEEVIWVCEANEAGVAIFSYTGINGCDSIHSVTYELFPLSLRPVAMFSTSPSSPILFPPGIVQTVNLSQNSNNYFWNFGDGSGYYTNTNPSHIYYNEGQYEIILIANNETNCQDTAAIQILLLEDLLIHVPNAFTPDGHSFNEVFLPIISGDFNPYNYSMLIFNRWGEILFESKNTNVGWDGTYNGIIIQDDIYIWKITIQSSHTDELKQFVGHVNLIR